MKVKTIFASIILFVQILSAEQAARSQHVNIQLLSEVNAVNPGAPFHVGIHFQLDDHWHVYWKNPGDAGLQPKFSWNLPDGFQLEAIQWPYPKKIMVGGLANYGYEDEVLLIARLMPPADPESRQQINIGVAAEWLVCKEECIPGEANLEISLPVTPAPSLPDERWIRLFSEARDNLPLRQSDWQIF